MEDDAVVEEGSLLSSVISRRNLIKAGAIVGGVVWAAPVIDSFASPASATSLVNYQHGCVLCFYLNTSDTAVLFGAATDDPTPTNQADINTLCSQLYSTLLKKSEVPKGITGGPALVYNTVQNFSFGTTGGTPDTNVCTYSSDSGLSLLSFDLTNTSTPTCATIPPALVGTVYCAPASWSASI